MFIGIISSFVIYNTQFSLNYTQNDTQEGETHGVCCEFQVWRLSQYKDIVLPV